MQIQLSVSGMSCGGCVKHVRGALEAAEGVSGATVEIGHARFELDPERGTIDAILSALAEEGYPAKLET
jgi:copper chaperone